MYSELLVFSSDFKQIENEWKYFSKIHEYKTSRKSVRCWPKYSTRKERRDEASIRLFRCFAKDLKQMLAFFTA